LTTAAQVRHVRVSVPLVPCLVDNRRYYLPDDLPPAQGEELRPMLRPRITQPMRAPRAPTLRSLVKLAVRCQDAEELGEKLRKRYQRQQARRGAYVRHDPTAADEAEDRPSTRQAARTGLTRLAQERKSLARYSKTRMGCSGSNNLSAETPHLLAAPGKSPHRGRNCSAPELTNEATPMLAEKFVLLMETLKSHASPDGAPRVVSASPHVPVKLPAATNK
jgi:hypothetical protein